MKTKLTFLCLLFIFSLQAQSEQELLENFYEEHKDFLLLPNTKDVILRDGCDNQPDSIVNRFWSIDGWATLDRTIFVYDDERRVTTQTQESAFSTNDIVLVEKQETTYTDDESITLLSALNIETNVFQIEKRITRSYVSEMLMSQEEEILENEEWVPYVRFDYSYEESSNYVIMSIWNINNNLYEPYLKITNAFTLIDGESYIDSTYQQRSIFGSEDWENIGIRIDYVRDEQLRLASLEVGSYFTIPDELVTVIREEYTYDETGDSYTALVYGYDSEAADSLFLNERVRNYFEDGLNTSDSTYIYEQNSDVANLNYVTNYKYDLDLRNYLTILLYAPEDNPEELLNSSQTQNYYQNCISETEEIIVETANCAFAIPLTNGQRGICNFEMSTGATLKIYDLLGRTTMRQTINNNEGFSFDNLPANGVYFLTIENEKGILSQRKVVVAN